MEKERRMAKKKIPLYLPNTYKISKYQSQERPKKKNRRVER